MKSGDGVYSYTKNSSSQRKFADNAKVMIREAIIENLDVQIKTFLIVDMGCSIGQTHFLQCKIFPEIEFHVFFNDHVTNDFNILFKSLFSDQKPYFASAIPGSFYGRLFPSCSLHIAPKELIDMKNKRRIHYDGAFIEVWNAYVTQFHKDMGVFLSARADEIVPGGLIVLILPAIPSEIPYSKIGYKMFTFLESSLIDMVNEGMLDESLVDSFNVPVYFPSIEDMTKVVEKNDFFSIEKIELTYPKSKLVDEADAKTLIINLTAVLQQLFINHFGNKITEEIFTRTILKSYEISAWMKINCEKACQLFVALKRK
ncbi:hypothetical protein R3W88_000032 [Solanum pinnatisectum]|uniref:S-adenosylmethionine-dependent methyltransferase n=1 Tax=Solanum pinnatisectum TaxID=50273 RepID=A0AAV9MGV3_9SOLN|nr:hypothetical protein R3W88_000032 [Solanum pinnatisectum]